MPKHNGKLSQFRPVGSSGSYPLWLLNLKTSSGCYVIKARRSGRVLYVGESHSGRLYHTLTRHFQEWSGMGAGYTTGRGRVLVAIKITSKRTSIDCQEKLIRRLKPKFNQQLEKEDDFAFGLNV